VPAQQPRDGAAYRRAAAAIRARGGDCYLCGRPIDTSLRYPHPASPSADHVAPIGRGGHPDGPLRAVHLVCNLRRLDGRGRDVDFTRPLEWDPKPGPVHSRDWW
jgi:hypothetical protein